MFCLFLFLLACSKMQAQIKEFDQLEMWFDQQHYNKVFKKSIKLIDNPEYDYSLLPLYYKTLSSLQLAKNVFWHKRNPNTIKDAEKNLKLIKTNSDGSKIWNAHYYELIFFKRDMIHWLEEIKEQKNEVLFQQINNLIEAYLSELPDIIEEGDKNKVKEFISNELDSKNSSKIREKIVKTSMKYLGVPYRYNGQNSDGFDCSGFSGFVYKQNEIEIPRSAQEQYNKSQHLKFDQVKKGDLIFFSNGTRISHVGIIVSNKGEPLIMIHSSSTNGIVVTEIEKSVYWQKRIAGYGTFFK